MSFDSPHHLVLTLVCSAWNYLACPLSLSFTHSSSLPSFFPSFEAPKFQFSDKAFPTIRNYSLHIKFPLTLYVNFHDSHDLLWYQSHVHYFIPASDLQDGSTFPFLFIASPHLYHTWNLTFLQCLILCFQHVLSYIISVELYNILGGKQDRYYHFLRWQMWKPVEQAYLPTQGQNSGFQKLVVAILTQSICMTFTSHLLPGPISLTLYVTLIPSVELSGCRTPGMWVTVYPVSFPGCTRTCLRCPWYYINPHFSLIWDFLKCWDRLWFWFSNSLGPSEAIS